MRHPSGGGIRQGAGDRGDGAMRAVDAENKTRTPRKIRLKRGSKRFAKRSKVDDWYRARWASNKEMVAGHEQCEWSE